MDSSVRGVRGAINVDRNDSKLIIEETKKLLLEIVKANNLKTEDICSVFFTMTQDLNAAFPALAARELGWTLVPMLCSVEINVAESLPRCIRVLMHVNTPLAQNEIKHVYLKEAQKLRDDL
ncbi:MAG: chorismate mutase [Candidatus Syntrophonatronum acetioxidans]|uniref:chorismate mutase n=1 Tax=Candidatus Syntrophonatronum acetioxidans TaxID=1795816 RepID=A0A424YC11_9FIRM|nr:MAG: chorismate mutase [Candidatus Syntrophonatronum acetioxidans]